MYGINEDASLATLAKEVATLLTHSTNLQTVSLDGFCAYKYAEAGEIILSALSSCTCLPKLTIFDCGNNNSWFQGKESNAEILIDAIRSMTAVEEIDVHDIELSTDDCDKLMKTLVANKAQNYNL